MAAVLVNVALALAWALMTGGFTLLNLAFGFVLGALALALIRDHPGPSGFRRGVAAGELALVFVYELLKSTVGVARIVLSGREPSPAIVAFPLSVTRDVEITLLANLITLTPGTLSIDVSDDRRTLFVHALDAPDRDGIVAGIRRSFERRIERVFSA